METSECTPRRASALSPPFDRLRSRRIIVSLAVGVVAVGVAWTSYNGLSTPRRSPPALASDGTESLPRVDVVRAHRSGLPRFTVQPGSVHAYQSADLFAMVSGYLKAQNVDIGSRVRKHEILAELHVPRENAAIVEAGALVEQSKAQRLQAEARVKLAEADLMTASAALAQTQADIERLVANRVLAEKQFARIEDLSRRDAISQKLLDEQAHEREGARAAERTARLGVETARSKVAAARATIAQAEADRDVASSAVKVAEARLAKAKVDVDYARIVAPFDGVVTRRNYHPGAYISAPAGGDRLPLLTVVRTDVMRVVVRVPDRDVVSANQGDPVELTVDALAGRTFRGAIARVAEAEDHQSRTMRVEIDLPNPDGVLREGMYGRAKICLEPAKPGLALPAACVVDRDGKGHGTVRVVRDGLIDRVTVELGADDGAQVEIVSGLKPLDDVVLRSNTPVVDGMKVITRAG